VYEGQKAYFTKHEPDSYQACVVFSNSHRARLASTNYRLPTATGDRHKNTPASVVGVF
jgi:hypothetical protein